MTRTVARVGLVVPADNAVIEPELYSVGVAGMSFHAYRITETEPSRMRAQAVDLAGSFGELGLDAAVYACAETSFEPGMRGNAGLAAALQEISGIPVTTATTAMLAAVRHLGLSTIGLVTPYRPASGVQLEHMLAAHGLKVASRVHRDFAGSSDDPRVWYETNRQPSTVVYELARGLDLTMADGVLVSATNLRTLDVVERLEAELGKPVVTCNQSILWWSRRMLGLPDAVTGHGRLLRSQP
ncbi:maleate cis-trans isomerase family protein [Phytohabitans kaempferiae]|uniref:Arylmalonate decarboxylase n=1 Tax=Phytohabitans kaempferiae TaxID=1620943 RepID=A0ABV6MB51_9ACTN